MLKWKRLGVCALVALAGALYILACGPPLTEETAAPPTGERPRQPAVRPAPATQEPPPESTPVRGPEELGAEALPEPLRCTLRASGVGSVQSVRAWDSPHLYSLVGRIPVGESVTALARYRRGWVSFYLVETQGGLRGWVSERDLRCEGSGGG